MVMVMVMMVMSMMRMMRMTTMVILMHMKYIGTGGIDHHVFTVLCFDLPNQVLSGQVAP